MVGCLSPVPFPPPFSPPLLNPAQYLALHFQTTCISFPSPAPTPTTAHVLASTEAHAYVEVDTWLRTGEEDMRSLSLLSPGYLISFVQFPSFSWRFHNFMGLSTPRLNSTSSVLVTPGLGRHAKLVFLEMAYMQASLYPVTCPHGLRDYSDSGDRSPRYIVLASETSPFTSQSTNRLQSRGTHLGNLSWGTVPHFPYPAAERNPLDSTEIRKRTFHLTPHHWFP